MKRFQQFRTGTSKSSAQDRQAALTGALQPLAQGLNGNLRTGGVLGDGTITKGNTNETVVPKVVFEKPGLPTRVAHMIGHTVVNWKAIDVRPPATIGRSNRRATRDALWLEALDNGQLDADGKFSPPVVATIVAWGEPGQEPRRR